MRSSRPAQEFSEKKQSDFSTPAKNLAAELSDEIQLDVKRMIAGRAAAKLVAAKKIAGDRGLKRSGMSRVEDKSKFPSHRLLLLLLLLLLLFSWPELAGLKAKGTGHRAQVEEEKGFSAPSKCAALTTKIEPSERTFRLANLN